MRSGPWPRCVSRANSQVDPCPAASLLSCFSCFRPSRRSPRRTPRAREVAVDLAAARLYRGRLCRRGRRRQGDQRRRICGDEGILRFGRSPARGAAAGAGAGPADRRAAKSLSAAIAAKAPPAEVDRMARGLAERADRRLSGAARAAERSRSWRAGPRSMPQNCASCHGATGDAKTPMATDDGSAARSPSPTAPGRRSAAPSPSTR